MNRGIIELDHASGCKYNNGPCTSAKTVYLLVLGAQKFRGELVEFSDTNRHGLVIILGAGSGYHDHLVSFPCDFVDVPAIWSKLTYYVPMALFDQH